MKICIRHRAEKMKINDDHFATCWMNVKQGLDNGEIEIESEGGDDRG